MFRQGDVLVIPIKPESVSINNLKRLSADDDGIGVTLVKGEKTNHHHRVPASTTEVYIEDVNKNGITSYIMIVKEPSNLDHYNVATKKLTTEHDSHTLAPGMYRVKSQRQWSLDDYILPAFD